MTLVRKAQEKKDKAFREFRDIKIKYVNEYRRITLGHKAKIDYYCKARDILIRHMLGAEEIRQKKRKSEQVSEELKETPSSTKRA
jgi:hypothetical protein